MMKVWIFFILLGYFCYDASPIPKHMVDMTYAFNNETLQHPGAKKFEIKFIRNYENYWYQLEEYSSSTHAGTHIDAPCELALGRWSIDEMPLNRLVAPVAVVNIEDKAINNRDYEITVNDLLEWETENGHLLNDLILMIRSGWGQRWGDRESYTGTAGYDPTQLHFPGISPEAAQWLVDERNIYGLGTDTPSPEYGPNTDFRVHKILCSENIFILENVANVDKLPPYGATLHVMPMKIDGACGAPVRILATLPESYCLQSQNCVLE